MSKTIYIGGRLESKEKGNVVAGANAILDDTKGKKQNVINKETDDELLRLEQSKQDNLTFDNAPTEDSTNPVTSGGVYTAEKALSDAIEAILLLIPSAATALNKLVDTNTMNSSISTATATFRGTYNAVTDLGLSYQATHAQIEAALDALGLTADNNDYAFVQVPVSDQSQDIAKTERYKNNGTNWQYEYDLNTSGFTAAQWAAINSGITVALVTKLTDLPTAAALQLALNAKQDTLTFDTEPTALSQNPVTSGGIFTAIQAVATALSNYSTATDNRLGVLEGLVPSEASSSNKLTDKAYVDGLIQAITELIPAEASTTNQLADKAYVLAQILAATPAFKGQFVTLAELQAVASPKAGDLGIVRTKDSDGMDVFTVYQYLSNAWGVFYSLSYHPQTKPATTGTTGDYPYNGMGRVELAKNMVNTGTELAPVYENQLTQDMFYTGAVGSRVPNTNTIFVIRYDYVLAENITIPDGCVLEFEGGSISGAYTLTGANTSIKANDVAIFNGVLIAGTWNCPRITAKWFADATQSNGIIRVFALSNTDYNEIEIPSGTYPVDTTVTGYSGIFIKSNTKVILDGHIHLNTNNSDSYHGFYFENAKNITICGSGKVSADADESSSTNEQGHLLFSSGTNSDIKIEGITFENSLGDGLYPFGVINNMEISHCKFNDIGRNGISTGVGTNWYIHDNIFSNINDKAPKAGIDLEADHSELGEIIRNVIIENNEFVECFTAVAVSANGDDIERVILRNNNIICTMARHYPLVGGGSNGHYLYNLVIENNNVKCADGGINFGNVKGAQITNNRITISDDSITAVSSMFEFNGCEDLEIRGNYIEGMSQAYFNNNVKTLFEGNILKVEHGDAGSIFFTTDEKYPIVINNSFIGKSVASRADGFVFCNNKLNCITISLWLGDSGVTKENYQVNDNVFITGEQTEKRCIYCYAGLSNSDILRNISDVSSKIAGVDFATVQDTNRVESIWTHGTTAQRPVYTAYYAGAEYYDTTLGKKILWNGSAWVNVDGSALA